MQVSDIEVLTRHDGPESWGGGREAVAQALTGERAGWVLSREKFLISGADPVEDWGRQQQRRRFGEATVRSARSKAPRMYACTMCENREIPPSSGYARPERVVKPKGARR